MRTRAFISIGSNTGDKALNCRKAVDILSGIPAIDVVKKSSFYETPPWGNIDQPSFVNAAVEIEADLAPDELLGQLKSIESAMGRAETLRWGPRVIDLDIIFYDDIVLETPALTIPHPMAHERAFVLVPLSEIAPDFVHPVLKKKVSELAAGIEGAGACRKMEAAQ